MRKVRVLFTASLVVLLVLIVYQQRYFLKNQRAQMKQQFHSDGIALVSLFGDEGLRKLYSVTSPAELSLKESFATGLLIQRFVVAYWIRNSFTGEEWQRMVVEDGQTLMRSQLLRLRWEKLKNWYPKEIQEFFEGTLLQGVPMAASNG